MSKELRIGTTKPASGASAFAVSRDSDGIFIAVRDNAAPQFTVGRDEGGLSVSAYPVPRRHFVLAAVQTMSDGGSNFAAVSAAWDAVGLDTCDFECFIAEPGANFTVNWSGHNVVMLAPRWAYPEVFTPNEHWLSLGVKTTHRPASETDIDGTSAIWAIPGDAQVVYSGGGFPGYWFIFRAPVRVDEPPWGMLRSYGLHAYYNLSVLPAQNGYVDCQLARNYVIAPGIFSPLPTLEQPSNYPVWPPVP